MGITYTQSAADFFLQITPDHVAEAWNEIDGIDLNDDEKGWQKKILKIAESYQYYSRFFLARYIDQKIAQDKGAQPKLVVGLDTPYFFEQTIEKVVEGLKKNQKTKYKAWMRDKAARCRGSENPEEQADIEQENKRIISLAWKKNAVESYLFRERNGPKPKNRLTRGDAIKLGHLLGFSVTEMNDYLMRVFELDESLKYNADDLIDIFCFLTGGSWWAAKQIKEEYRAKKEELKKSGRLPVRQPVADAQDPRTKSRMFGFTEKWKNQEYNNEKKDEFIDWLLTDGPDENQISRTSTAIYRNLAASVWIYCETDIYVCTEKLNNLKKYLEVLPDDIRETALTRSLLMKDGKPDPEVCKKLAGDLTLANQKFAKAKNMGKSKTWFAPSMNRGGLSSSAGISTEAQKRIADILMGSEGVEKTDLLLLYFFVFTLIQREIPTPKLADRVREFQEGADRLLEACCLPRMYLPHLAEQAMLCAIIAAGQNRSERKKIKAPITNDPLSIYVHWMEALRTRENEAKKEWKLGITEPKKEKEDKKEGEKKAEEAQEEKNSYLSPFKHPTEFSFAVLRDESIRAAERATHNDEDKEAFFRKNYDISRNNYNVELPKQQRNIDKVPQDYYRRYLSEVWKKYTDKHQVPRDILEKCLGRKPDERQILLLAEVMNYGQCALNGANLEATAKAYGIGQEERFKWQEEMLRQIENGTFDEKRAAKDAKRVKQLTLDENTILKWMEVAFFHWENPDASEAACMKYAPKRRVLTEQEEEEGVILKNAISSYHARQLKINAWLAILAVDDQQKNATQKIRECAAQRGICSDQSIKVLGKRLAKEFKCEITAFLYLMAVVKEHGRHNGQSWEECAKQCGIPYHNVWCRQYENVIEVAQYRYTHPGTDIVVCKKECNYDAKIPEEQQDLQNLLDARKYYETYKALGIEKCGLQFQLKGARGDLLSDEQKNLVKFLLLLNYFVKCSDNHLEFRHGQETLEDRQQAIGLRQEDLEDWQQDVLMMLKIARKGQNTYKRVEEYADRLGYGQRTERQDAMLRVLMVMLDERLGAHADLCRRAQAQVSEYRMEPLTGHAQDLLNLVCLLYDKSFWEAISLEAYLPQSRVELFKDMKPQKLAQLLRLLREYPAS